MINPMIGMPQGAEWLVILAIVVLVFGAAKLPELARSSGQALRIVKSAATALDTDPAQARRALIAQAVELRKVGEAVKDGRLVEAAAALETCMGADLTGGAGRVELVKRIDALMGFMAAEDTGRAA